MGADLYIKKLLIKDGEISWESKDGYFRDSYNDTSVLWKLGLSWWQDVTPMLNRQGNLSGKNLIKFRDMVVNAKQENLDKESLLKKGLLITATGEDSAENWEKYFIEKRQKLIDFLNRAIKNKLSVRCSL